MPELVKYSAACRALALAKDVDEVKDVRDKAVAIQLYARQAKNRQLEVDAAELRIRAERRLGQLLKATAPKRAKGSRGSGRPRIGGSNLAPPKPRGDEPTLAEMGIDKKLSAHTPGWVCKSLMADYIAYAILPLGKCYLLPVIQLQQAWLLNCTSWCDTYPVIRAENTSWITVSVGVPVSVLFKAIGKCLRVSFTPIDGEPCQIE